MTTAAAQLQQLEIDAAIWDCQIEYEPAVQTAIPPPANPGRYALGTRVEVVKPALRLFDDGMRDQVKAKKYDWMGDNAPVINGHVGVVADYVRHPQMDKFIHVVRLDHMPQGRNVILMDPDGIKTAVWKGQLVMVANPGAKYDTTEKAWVNLMPKMTEQKRWAESADVVANKTARVQAVIKHPKTKREILICRLEPGEHFFMIDPAGVRDVKVLPQAQRPKPVAAVAGTLAAATKWPKMPSTPRPGGGGPGMRTTWPQMGTQTTAAALQPQQNYVQQQQPHQAQAQQTYLQQQQAYAQQCAQQQQQRQQWQQQQQLQQQQQWQQQQQQQDQQQQQWQQHHQYHQQVAQNLSIGERNRQDAAACLAQGKLWSKVLDPTSNCYYYRNNQTGESLWTAPAGWDEATQSVRR
eukprot:TRINITY_DN9422_c0_g1_i7.p1 TRINITY_DN9422_c0_g1~~TRINITY_DN9422_c0_g1_i7.p1  ORF type:complete len:408 (+),score=132.44 TRINITY_DN9422_c0_g1_i7:100-1323(+)